MGLWLPLLFRVVYLKLLFLFYFPSFSSSLQLLCHPDQSFALLQFKSTFAIDYDHHLCDQFHPRTTLWENGTDCCSWAGVTCASRSGHVIGLDLSCSGLQGEIHPNSTLFSLAHLTSLDLSSNKLSGSIPPSISYLQHLTDLGLSFNEFSGKIPDVFGGLTELANLDLSGNNLEGQLPSSLFNLSQLFHLDCSSNKLHGPLPNIRNISSLPNLAEFHLYDNFLSGKIPSSFLSLPSLDFVLLYSNQFTGFTGTISSNILITLDLYDNKLQGNIPESIFNVESLTDLSLSLNNLSGPINLPLSSKVQNLSLQILELSSCNFTEFPKFLGNLSNLNLLDLSNNKLHGKVPKWLYEMHSLDILNISQNLLTSMDQFSWNHKMRHLDLSLNLLNGDITSSICDASLLEILNLSYNNLTGVIPQCLVNSSSLLVLDLEMNKFHGTLPSTFPMNNKFQVLNLNDNQLQGPLPKSLSKCTHLDVLILANNQIEDTFPFWLQTLPNLKVLVLRENKFHGQITNLNKKQAFPSLIIVDISNNNFGGPLPTGYFKNFEAMVNAIKAERNFHYLEYTYENLYKYVTLYHDSLLVTMKGINIKLSKIPTAFIAMDFSRNKFEGEIPYVIGELLGLKVLNLSHNRLNSPIPRSIGNLTNLESLDLSSNMLIGGIPTELTSLNFLEALNLSQNHLVGAIPHGKQFDTFSNESYEGNLGLCGDPLSIKCNKDPKQQSPISPTFQHEQIFGFGWKPVAIGYGFGVVFGMFLGYCVFLMGKPQWIVRMVESEPNKREKRRRRMRTHRNHNG